MATWSDHPDPEQCAPRWQILRAKANGSIRGLILSDTYVGVYTHYFRGRTTPHEQLDCQPCAAGQRPRWYAYVAAEIGQGRERVILELTAACWPTLDAYKKTHSTFRGAEITVARTTAKANARLHASIRSTTIDPDRLPDPPNLKEILSRIWETDHTDTKNPTPIDAVLKRLQQAPQTNGHT